MKNKYLRTLGSILITSVFLLLAFGSDDSNKTSSPSPSISTSSSTDIPEGYQRGMNCSDCSGTGYYTHDMLGGCSTCPKKGQMCAGCNGRGFTLVKKN
jgi:hypothetical protein